MDKLFEKLEGIKFKLIPLIILSTVFLVFYFKILLLFVTGDISPKSEYKDVLLILIGILTREVPTIMQFWFGSSHGSKQKTASKSS